MIRTCQDPTCAIRPRPGNPTPHCFRHGGTPPERIDTRVSHAAPAPGTRPRGYDPRRDRNRYPDISLPPADPTPEGEDEEPTS